MKIRVAVTVDLDEEQVRHLVWLAESFGHKHDGTKNTRTLIRRLLEGKILDTVAYCHEHSKIDEETDED